MVLCNLAYLSEKAKRFGYFAALRELKEAQLGLRFERKKFLDFRSWQDMYCAWSDQVNAESTCPLGFRSDQVNAESICPLGFRSDQVNAESICPLGFRSDQVNAESTCPLGFRSDQVNAESICPLGFRSDQVNAESICPLEACKLSLESAMDSSPF
jgi:hypothetical protein